VSDIDNLQNNRKVNVKIQDATPSDPHETAEKKGKPYQSLVNEILAEEMRKASS